MFTEHPFVERIRLERTVIGMVNEHCSRLNMELGGLSSEAIHSWFSRFPQEMRNNQLLKDVRGQLEYMGKHARISSNGSHRGAMIAPPSGKDITAQQISILRSALEKLVS